MNAPKNCAAAQAHRRLVVAASRILRDARNQFKGNWTGTGQQLLDLAEELIGLTRLLYTVLHSAPPAPELWTEWVARVRELAATDPVRREGAWRGAKVGEKLANALRLKVLLESILIVRWGDAGAMLVSPLPTRQARARFGHEGQVQP